ncbi:MAG: hypothetical protein Ct9H90mP13_08760 [Pseudomonadota bacterium]|nr:MAG: hypothetical protein Ct9H90mP13_08760 [Pseudomonadota bacterium]
MSGVISIEPKVKREHDLPLSESSHRGSIQNLGYQDISASVDFTQLADTAFEEGFFIDLFTSQGVFLSMKNL